MVSLALRLWVPAAAGLLLVAGVSFAATIHVPSDLPSIQGAILASGPGDSVLVAPGTYVENLTMRPGVILTSEQGAEATVVDGNQSGAVILSNGNVGFVVEGFTLRNGRFSASPGGAGVSMLSSSGRFLHCIFADNVSGLDGGGISVTASQVTIRNSIFRHNEANAAGFLDGGAIFCFASNMILEDCLIVDNLADEGGGIVLAHNSTAAIRGCVIANNQATSTGVAGGGLASAVSTGFIENNTFVGNHTPLSGACVFFVGNGPIFQQNIIANSTGVGMNCGGFPTACNDVWNSQGGDYQNCPPKESNLSADPLFCDLLGLDLRLDERSPCAPGNTPAGCGLIGAFDVGCGPVAVAPTTWGAIKASFVGERERSARSPEKEVKARGAVGEAW